MLHITINGQTAIPSATTQIKITAENPYLSERGSYTYQITFPLDIDTNRAIFGNINRKDTTLRTAAFQSVVIYIDNTPIISGRGILLSLTDTEARLQIAAGKSAARYSSAAEKLYIDKIDYGNCNDLLEEIEHHTSTVAVPFDYDKQLFIGEPGKYCFCPIYDIENKKYRNFNYNCMYNVGQKQYYYNSDRLLYNPAPQPALLHIITTVCQKLGYTLDTANLKSHPLSRIYIANTTPSANLYHALPHWTAAHFLRQIELLFAFAFLFDDQRHTAHLVPFMQATAADIIQPTVVDTFTAEITTDTLQTPLTTNIAFDFSEDEDLADLPGEELITAENSKLRTSYEILPEDTFKRYKLYNVPDGNSTPQTDDLLPIIDTWTRRDLETTIFHLADGYYYVLEYSSDKHYIPRQCGIFMPFIQTDDTTTDNNETTDNTETLQIIPAITLRNPRTYYGSIVEIYLSGHLPAVAPRHFGNPYTEKETFITWDTLNPSARPGNTFKYTTAHNYLFREAKTQEGAATHQGSFTGDKTEEAEENTGTISLFYLYQYLHNQANDDHDTPDGTSDEDTTNTNRTRLPYGYTDAERVMDVDNNDQTTADTLALPYLHSQARKLIPDNLDANTPPLTPTKTHTTYTFTVISHRQPSPLDIYQINGRRYLCLKVESTITNNQLQPTHQLQLIQL